MKTLYCMLVCFSVFLFSNDSPVFEYTSIPKKYIQNKAVSNAERKTALQSLLNPYFLEKSLPVDFVRNASVDYTDALQKGINEHGDIILPDFPVLINAKGLHLKSNTKIYFPEHSKIILQANALAGYEIFAITNAQNIHLYYPNITGDKNKHLDKNGEWGFGISIKQSNNIIIENPVISLCQGDGIYIGGANKPSQNITVNNAIVDNNRRNGLSVTSGINIKINSCIFSNTNGKGPGSGIDIEPNNNQNEISNIVITNTITFNNEHWGLLVNLVNLRKGNSLKNVKIDVSNHIDDKSDYGMALWITAKKKNGKGVAGNINIVNSRWMNSRSQGFQYFENDSNKVNVLFKNLKIYRNCEADNKIDLSQVQNIRNKYADDNHFKFLSN